MTPLVCVSRISRTWPACAFRGYTPGPCRRPPPRRTPSPGPEATPDAAGSVSPSSAVSSPRQCSAAALTPREELLHGALRRGLEVAVLGLGLPQGPRDPDCTVERGRGGVRITQVIPETRMTPLALRRHKRVSHPAPKSPGAGPRDRRSGTVSPGSDMTAPDADAPGTRSPDQPLTRDPSSQCGSHADPSPHLDAPSRAPLHRKFCSSPNLRGPPPMDLAQHRQSCPSPRMAVRKSLSFYFNFHRSSCPSPDLGRFLPPDPQPDPHHHDAHQPLVPAVVVELAPGRPRKSDPNPNSHGALQVLPCTLHAFDEVPRIRSSVCPPAVSSFWSVSQDWDDVPEDPTSDDEAAWLLEHSRQVEPAEADDETQFLELLRDSQEHVRLKLEHEKEEKERKSSEQAQVPLSAPHPRPLSVSLRLCFCLSACICVSFSLGLSLSLFVCVCVCVCLHLSLSVYRFLSSSLSSSVSVSFPPSLPPSFSLSLSLSLSLPLSLALFLCPSISLSHSIRVSSTLYPSLGLSLCLFLPPSLPL